LPATSDLLQSAVPRSLAVAWSHLSASSSSPCDRKTFLRDNTSCLIGAATLVGGNLATSTPATAAADSNDKIYEVTPGSLREKVILITGASSGLGLESAKRLAVGGATLILTTRSNEKNQQAIQQVQAYLEERQLHNNANLYALVLDLDDFETSIKSFPGRYKKLFKNGSNHRPIDVLMNNAGVAAIPTRQVTKDGFERTFQSNHLGPFLLTALLFPLLHRAGGDVRVINVSSYAHQLATLHSNSSKQRSQQPGLDLDNLNGELSPYEPWPTYGRSKLENILFTQELQHRAETAGLDDWLTVVSLHPGVVGTDIWRYTFVSTKQNMSGNSDPSSLQRLASNLFYKSALTIEQGANTQVWLASAAKQEIQKGQYYDENRKVKALAPFAHDVNKARVLWEKSEQMVGMKFVVE
jgi:NAD(P)-dependent dehydrogenase (short-subunit alcohol dehydrogenase family)